MKWASVTDEGRQDRDGEDLVGDGDAGEGDHRHPDRLRIATTTPIDSAPSQLSQPSANSRFCSRVRPAARGSEMAPVLAQDLEAAIGPAMALLLEGFEGVGQQPVTVAPVGVMDLPALLEHGRPRSESSTMVSLDQPPAESSAERRIRHIVPCTMMALASLR